MKRIYFDHSATTPVDKRVLKEMLPYFGEIFGNASSMHSFGREAYKALEQARGRVAGLLNCAPGEIIFTSGSTESNNLVLRGIIKALGEGKKAHIITSSIEHDSVMEPCADLEKQGVAVTYLPVKPSGVVDVGELRKAIRPETILVSIMYANNEVGVIQPIAEIAQELSKRDKKIYFHTDATQAVNALDCDVNKLGVDFLSLSAHKIYGPKGVGALFIKNKSPLKGIQLGGRQEKNLRSGTINVSGIVGLGKAAEIAGEEREKNNKKIGKLRQKLVKGIIKSIPDLLFNTDVNNSLPSHAHFSFRGAEGESILLYLDMEGIAVSTGSACASGSLEASHVLSAMGVSEEIAHGSIRFSLGKYNTHAEISKLLKKLPPIIGKLRKLNPIYKK
ncbi:MAG: cysteine desulfurase family protein [Candidatus Pacebacteria bacterium]|nr:cysteine desulfurase family protein [Candidatus Paceibacterota bacterium]